MTAGESANFLHHEACPVCGSSDANAVYDDGHTHCFSCNAHTAATDTRHRSPAKPERSLRIKNTNLTPVTDVFRAIPRRGLTEDSIEKYQIDINLNKEVDVAHRYPYFKNGEHVANKVRRRETKDFYWEGNPKGAELFGQSLFPANSAKAITIVEGELDAPSAYQLAGSKYPVVSVPSAASAVRACRDNYEYLNSFDKIVICFDKDEPKVGADGIVHYPGQDAAKAVAQMFPIGKAAILTLQHGKDPNEYLTNGINPAIYVKEWWQAPVVRPDGIKSGEEMWDEIANRPSHFSVSYPWEGLQRMTYGMRLSEAVLLMADTGVGKTSVFSALELNILQNPEVIERGYGVGLLHLEEPNFDTALHLMSNYAGKAFHLPDVEKTEEELREAYDAVVNSDRLLFYDHFGSNDINTVIDKIRHMAVMGCKYIFVDHLSIIVSDQAGDERKDLDEISTKLKTLTIELDIAVCCIIHTNRQGEARGSAGPEKVANIHISLERDKEEPCPIRRNIMKMTVKKNRFAGRTGPACYLYFDADLQKLVELDAEAIMKYEEGVPMTVNDLPWTT